MRNVHFTDNYETTRKVFTGREPLLIVKGKGSKIVGSL